MGVFDTKPLNFNLRAWPTAQVEGAVPQMNAPQMQITPTQVPQILANTKNLWEELGSGLLNTVAAFSPEAQEKRQLEKFKLRADLQKSESEMAKANLETRLLEQAFAPKQRAAELANSSTEIDNQLKSLALQKAQWESGNWGADVKLSNEEKVAKIRDLDSQIEQRQSQQKLLTTALSPGVESAGTGESVVGTTRILATLPGGKSLTQVTYEEPETQEISVGGVKVPVGTRMIKKTKVMETGEEAKALTDAATDKLNKFEQGFQDIQLLQQDYNRLVELSKAGFLKGRASGALGWFGGGDPDIKAYQNRLTSIVPGLARGVFGEVGVLTDKDVARYTKVLSDPATNPEIAQKNFQQLIDKMQRGYKGAVETYGKAGYNVKGFNADALNMLKEETAKTETPKTDDIPVMQTPEDAWKLPSNIKVFKTPTGQLKNNPNFKTN